MKADVDQGVVVVLKQNTTVGTHSQRRRPSGSIKKRGLGRETDLLALILVRIRS